MAAAPGTQLAEGPARGRSAGPVVPAVRRPGRPDLVTLAGLALAVGGIIGGMLLEGGQLRELVQGTAALIVFGGTLGAVMVTTPFRLLKNAGLRVKAAFWQPVVEPAEIIDELATLATKARKHGVVSLENDLAGVSDAFLRKALSLAVDGADVKELKQMMDIEIYLEAQQWEESARVFTAAGGYAPTVGIIGAVLGLMQVMKNLANIDEVGRGIATAFVATVYGVGFANIVLIPLGSRIRATAQTNRQIKELMLRGVIAIAEGVNPKLMRIKLEAYTNHWEVRFAAAKDSD